MEMTQAEILAYLDLVAAAMRLPNDENIDAVEAYEAAYPMVADAAYTMGQKGELTGAKS